jgi:putative oxidoreductase
MHALSLAVTAAERLVLVLLFLPFSVLDKTLNYRGAVQQAAQIAGAAAPLLIVLGLCVEVFTSLAILTGVGDRLGAFILGGYCAVTALLWKRFWAAGDFWAGGKGRDLFWDFLKNMALAAGVMFITFGTGPADVRGFLSHPLASSRPYAALPLTP